MIQLYKYCIERPDHNFRPIGDDTGTASELEKTGAKHSNCAVDRYVVDTGNKIITTPAYMFGTAKPHQIFEGVSGAIKELIQMA